MEMEQAKARVWINRKLRRFYSARIGRDMFGGYYIEKVNGSLTDSKGKAEFINVPSIEAGVMLIEKISKVRSKHGYLLSD